MTDPRTIIKRIRGIPPPTPMAPDAIQAFFARSLKETRMYEIYKGQEDIVQERNMKEEQKIMAEQLERQRLEALERIRPAQEALQAKRELQEEINKERLKNLKKARKVKNGA